MLFDPYFGVKGGEIKIYWTDWGGKRKEIEIPTVNPKTTKR